MQFISGHCRVICARNVAVCCLRYLSNPLPPTAPQIFSHLVRAPPNGSIRCVVMDVSLKWSQYHRYLVAELNIRVKVETS